tara:strand:- start:223 stop:705 length:483 start_codon:yes stop_codon:yes gene_type:complete
MFSSGAIATAKDRVFKVGSFTDKFGTRRGFVANPNSTPPWEQQGSSTSTVDMHGGLDPVSINIGSDAYQIVQLTNFAGSISLVIYRPSGTASLAFDSITSISTELGTLNTADASQFNNSSTYGNPNFDVSTWNWNPGSGGYVPQDIIGVAEITRSLTVTE